MISIAIDGPAGAGKSTVAKILSKELGFIYFDTGALYRALGYYFVNNKIDYTNVHLLVNNLNKADITFKFVGNEQRMILCGEDITDSIRSNQISMAASRISAILEAREYLLNAQREMATKSNVIMDGRDIGTVVLPYANVKIFLTADVRVRAWRRFRQLRQKDIGIRYIDVLKQVKERDKNDTEREISPLVPAKDAIIVNTTMLTLNRTINKLIKIVRKRIDGKK